MSPEYDHMVAKHGGGLIEAALPVTVPWHGVAEGEDGCHRGEAPTGNLNSC